MQYHRYLQSVLKLLFPSSSERSRTRSEVDRHEAPTVSWANQQPFLNVSITPIECSIVCTKELAQQFFGSCANQSPRAGDPKPDHATISSEDFVVISVEGEGLEAGQRVLELTTPLALAGMYENLCHF